MTTLIMNAASYAAPRRSKNCPSKLRVSLTAAVIRSMTPLTTKEERPRAINVSGSVRSLAIGRTEVLTRLKMNATNTRSIAPLEVSAWHDFDRDPQSRRIDEESDNQ